MAKNYKKEDVDCAISIIEECIKIADMDKEQYSRYNSYFKKRIEEYPETNMYAHMVGSIQAKLGFVLYQLKSRG